MRISRRLTIAAVAVGAIGVGLMFMPSDMPFVLDIPTYDGTPVADGVAYVLISSERAASVAMLWVASLLGCVVLGLRSAGRFSLPPTVVVVYVGTVVAVVGLVMVFVIDATPTFTIGSFGTGPQDDAGRGMPFLLFLTPARAIGFALVWIATLLASFSTGRIRAASTVQAQAVV